MSDGAGVTETVFAAVTLPEKPGAVFDISVRNGKIASLTPTDQPAQWVALPPLADLHLHANRAFTIGDQLPKDFDDAIALVTAMVSDFGAADYERQAKRLFDQIHAKGTARARTHADIGGAVGMKALEGTLAARASFRDRLDIAIVAFASNADDPADPAINRLLRCCHAEGADLLGAVPAYYADPARSIDAILDLALSLDCGVDLHLDEHLDGARAQSLYLAQATEARRMAGRVTLSHGCAISALNHDQQQRIADALARAGVTVIALPATNLYLQERGPHTPRRRGLTAVKEMINAGVAVRFASDNIQDVFYPYGSGDMLDIAALAATAAHAERPVDLIPAICDGRLSLNEGDAADFILIEGASFGQIIAERPQRRQRVAHGVTVPLH